MQFMKKNIYLKRLCLLLLVVLCTILLFFLQYRYDNKYHFPGIQGEQGILDLRSDRQPLSVLTYGWEIYPQKLIAPGEFNGRSLILSIWDSTEVLKPEIKTAILMAAPRIG